ncbi:MAG TPA: hypothetical protein VFC93_11745 [Chloroflexota bacterium]|nr:hypothetical protein [Chloroflexota bacterium]
MSRATDEADAYDQLRARLAEQLVDLRAQFQEAVASYSVKVQGELAEAGDILTADDPTPLSRRERQARAQALRAALARVGSLSLKPGKGRRRDLKAIQELARDLARELAEW